MGFDSKYGQIITEHGDIPDHEQVVVFRARDITLPELLYSYRQLCMQAGASKFHVGLIDKAYQDIKKWQEEHPDEVKVPSSDAYKERISGHSGA